MNTMRLKYLISVMALVLISCTKENLESCFQGIELDYDFTLHTNDANRFDEDVQRVSAYLFDQNDVLQYWATDNGSVLKEFYMNNGNLDSIVTANTWGKLPNDYVMKLRKVVPGTYKVMSWAGSETDNTTFYAGHMNDPLTHDFERGVTLGRTTMTDFRMFVDYRDADEYPEEAIIPAVDEIEDLWYGAVGDRHAENATYTFKPVTVKSGAITKCHIELIRNTNILKVTVSGTDFVNSGTVAKSRSTRGTPLMDETGMKLWVRASNGRYKADNSVGENARTIRYNPHMVSIGDNQLLADIKVLSLNIEQRSAQPMYLYFEDNKGAQYPQGGIDVVNTLLQAKNPDGTYVYANDADFYKEYEHPITIDIGADLSIKIIIRGWEIIIVKPELN